MAETIETVETLIASIDRTVNIDSVVDNGNGTCNIFTCDTKWIQALFSVTIGGNDFPVIAINVNVSITITGACPVVSTFEAYPPFFFHGTVTDTNLQLNGITTIDSEKSPMGYLYEPFVENLQDEESALEMITPVRIFFLGYANTKAWYTPQHYEETIKPMRNLMNGFVKAAQDSELIDTLGEYSVVSRVKFGTLKSDKGYEKARFDMHLSGVELGITLPIRRIDDCKC